MPGEQKEIYYLIGESRELMEQSPHLEAFKAKGREVLLLTDPIDEFVVESLHEYKGKTLKAVDKGGARTDGDRRRREEEVPAAARLFKEKLPEIKEVRLSKRLKESAVCLVADEERLQRQHGS